jgi:hypothetical protein
LLGNIVERAEVGLTSASFARCRWHLVFMEDNFMEQKDERKRNRTEGQEVLRRVPRLGMIRYPRMHRGGRTPLNLWKKTV